MRPPLLKRPPAWPLPDPIQDAAWYGSISVRYPLQKDLLSANLAVTLHAKSLFRIIMNEFCVLAFSKDQTTSIHDVETLHRQLQRWYQDLPTFLKPQNIVLPSDLQLQ
jgi:hypothetical protein